jgi:MoaA/NifB/PqqE/SkfB family radical SAM enzyme
LSKFKYFNLIPGNKCDLACAHCANSSGPKYNNSIGKDDIENISLFLNSNKIENIILTGGEPTLYLNVINQVIDSLSYQPHVTITTNGLYAKLGELGILTTIGKLRRVDHIQLSYDKFHGNLDTKIITNLRDYCLRNEIGFNISYCIESPMDLLEVSKIQNEFGVKIIFERTTNSGRAKKTNSNFKFPVFEEAVLSKKCPNVDVISYICGKGFSHCCSNVTFNNNNDAFYNYDIKKYLDSDFYKLSSDKTMEELMYIAKIDSSDLTSDMSMECNLCELAMLEIF